MNFRSRLGVTAGLLLLTFGVAHAASWTVRQFDSKWDPDVANFINNECQPSGLDGIHMVATQLGHGAAYHLYVACRADKNATARYKVSMLILAGEASLPDTMQTALGNPNVRTGPYYYGNQVGKDGMWVIEKTQ